MTTMSRDPLTLAERSEQLERLSLAESLWESCEDFAARDEACGCADANGIAADIARRFVARYEATVQSLIAERDALRTAIERHGCEEDSQDSCANWLPRHEYCWACDALAATQGGDNDAD